MMFSYRERMLAVIPRWSVLPRTRDQSVAEHSFYVALYVDKLVIMLKWPVARRYQAVQHALKHDMPEIVTGDIMGPVKRTISNPKAREELELRVLASLGEYYTHEIHPPAEIKRVLKAANIIDEFFYTQMEVSMGNKSLIRMRDMVTVRLARALQPLGLSDLLPDLMKEAESMAEGLDFPQEDSDVG